MLSNKYVKIIEIQENHFIRYQLLMKFKILPSNDLNQSFLKFLKKSYKASYAYKQNDFTDVMCTNKINMFLKSKIKFSYRALNENIQKQHCCAPKINPLYRSLRQGYFLCFFVLD